MTPSEVAKVAESLTEAQRKALLALDAPSRVKLANGDVAQVRNWHKASEIGVSGNTLRSLYGLGGVHPTTFLLGPILVVDDLSREGRHWSLTHLGEVVRDYLRRTG